MVTRSWWPLAGVLAAALVGCGGGDGDPGRTPTTPPGFEGLTPLVKPDGTPYTPKVQVHSDDVLYLNRDGSPATPNFPDGDAGLEATGTVYGRTDLVRTGVAGTFDLTIYPDLTFAANRTGQTQGDKYLLPVHQFFRNKVQPQSVRRLPNDRLEVIIRFEHPFPRPADLQQPATALKRADLHIFNVWAGFLVNGTENFFGGQVTTNTRALVNADSYRQVTGMVTIPAGTTANTFPGKLVSDLSPANADPAQDNYDPTFHGWVGSAVQDPRGFGVFAQGASRDITFQFDPGAGGGTLNLRGVILADYTDPRGGATAAERRANRLPNPLDPAALRYILPHGAGDLQQIAASPSGTLPEDASRSIDVNVQIIDLDADAAVANPFPNEADLSQIAVPSDIASVTASIPTLVTGDLTGTEATGSGSGLPGSPKRWAVPVTNTDSRPAGTYRGLVRVVDEESNHFGSEFYVTLNESLQPLPTPLPIQAFQAFNVVVGGATGTENIIEANALGIDWEAALNAFIQDPARNPPAPGPMTNFRLWDLAVDPTNHDYWIAWSGTGALNWGALAGFTGPAVAIARIAFDPVNPGAIAFYPVFQGFGFDNFLPVGGFRLVMTDERYLAMSFTIVDGAGFFAPPDPMIDGRALVMIFRGDMLTFDPPFTFPLQWFFFWDDVRGTAQAPEPVHQQDFDHAYAIWDHDFDRDPTMPNTGQHNDLMAWIAMYGTYSTTTLPTDYTGQTQARLLDAPVDPPNDDALYGVTFYPDFVGPNSMEGQFPRGTGDCQVRVERVGGVDGPDNEDAVFVADNDDNRVETYTVLNDDPAQAITCLNRNSPPVFTDMFGLAVAKDNSVYVLDRGGAGATTDRLTLLDPATLAVRGSLDLATSLLNEIGDPPVPLQGVAVAIEADESALLPAGDNTTVAVLHTAGIDEFIIEVP